MGDKEQGEQPTLTGIRPAAGEDFTASSSCAETSLELVSDFEDVPRFKRVTISNLQRSFSPSSWEVGGVFFFHDLLETESPGVSAAVMKAHCPHCLDVLLLRNTWFKEMKLVWVSVFIQVQCVWKGFTPLHFFRNLLCYRPYSKLLQHNLVPPKIIHTIMTVWEEKKKVWCVLQIYEK